MPGNEVADKVHNFFEQDNLSQGHQSQVGSGSWPGLNNNNLWAGIQRQNGTSISSNPKNYAVQFLDSERENGRPSQMPFSTNLTQLTLRPEFTKAQNRNQQLNLNGFMHVSQGFQTRANQAEYLGEDTVSDRHNVASRGLATLEPQQENPSEYNSGLVRDSERSEIAEAPVNFDFLGGQSQLMRSQHPGMSQPRPRQQSGINDMQLLQQHLMYRQLQELQRQQQFQQLNQEAKQQNSVNQLSAFGKQAALDQLPPLVNGMPIHDASNYMWQNESMEGDSKIPNSSQMFMVGNMRGAPPMPGYPNGLMYSNDQGQVLRSMGFVPQHLDQSLYGTPVSNTRNSLNQYSQFQGMSHDSADMMTKDGGSQAEKLPMQSAVFNSFQNDQLVFPGQGGLQDGLSTAKQGFLGKSLFGQYPVQNVNSGAISGNFQQVNPLARSMQVQEFQARQERSDWSGNLQEKSAAQAGPSQGLVSLDPTEQKLLFSTDDEGNWDAAFGRSANINSGGYLHGNSLEGNDYFNAFPSVQSGSWSALMQSAVAEASSSDTGVQDEWSGLSFQKTDLSGGNHDCGKQQTGWVDNNLQAASSLTSRPYPLFGDSNISSNDRSAPNFQQSSIKFGYEQSDRVLADASHDSLQQSSKEASKQLDQSPQQKQFFEGCLQAPMHLENASRGVWEGQLYEQSTSTTHSAEIELNSRNSQGSWAPQQNMASYDIASQLNNKTNGWNINEPLPSSGDNTFKVHHNESTVRHAQMNDPNTTTGMDGYRDVSMWKFDGNRVAMGSGKSGNSNSQMRTEDSYKGNFAAVMDSNTLKANHELNQQVHNRHEVDYGKHVAVDSSLNSKGNDSVGKYQFLPNKGPQVWESSMNSSDKVSGGTFDRQWENSLQREVTNESHMSNQSHPSQHTDTRGGTRENSLLGGNDSRPLISGNQKSSGQIGRKTSGTRKFQYHPMGNLGVNAETTDSPRQKSYSQGLSQTATHGLKSQEQGYIGQAQFAASVASNNAVDMEKRYTLDSQRNTKGTEDIHTRGAVPGHDSNISASFEESGVFSSQNKRAGQTSQNMLELLHKVDQSRDNTVARFGISDQNTASERPEPGASDGSAAHLQNSQSSALQGFSLRLAPPSQRLSVAHNALSSQTSQTYNDFNSRHFDSAIGAKNQTWSNSTVSVQSQPPTHELSQRDNWDDKSSISGKSGKETSHSNMQGNSSAVGAPNLPYTTDQVAQQRIFTASGHVVPNQSNLSFGGQADLSASRHSSHLRQPNDSHEGAVANQSSQPSLPGAASRISPFRLASPSDTRVPVVPQSYSTDASQSQPMYTSSSYLRSSGQQLPVPETKPVSQFVTSGMSQQGGFSAMLHNVWTNVSAQQRLSGGQSQKAPPNIFQSKGTSSLNRTSATRKSDDQGDKKGGSAPSEFGACSINSQQFTYGEEQLRKDNCLPQIPPGKVDCTPQAPKMQELVAKHTSDGNSAVPISSLVRLHQQDLSRGKHEQDSSLDQQTGHVTLPNAASSNCDVGAYGRTFKPSDVQHQNYSLLQQMQAMKAVEMDPSKRVGKRLKGVDFGVDAQQMVGKEPQKFLYGYNTSVKVSADNELSAASHCMSFPSNAKMLSFSMEGNEDQNANRSSQLVGREVPSQDFASSGRNDPQNYSQSLCSTSMSPSVGGIEHVYVNPQMAPSWFEQHGNIKNGQILAMHNGLGSSQRTANTAAQHYFFAKVSESMDTNTVAEQKNDASLVGCAWKNVLNATAANEHSSSLHCLPSDSIDHSLVMRPKKRKSATSELLPWHQEISQGSQRLRRISMAELDWAQASNRLIEKVEDEAEMSEDGPSMPRPRRRLILTTQLMQQLLPSIPTTILSANTTSEYESVVYFVSKLALGDACGLISCSGSRSHEHSESGNTIREKLQNSEWVGDQFFFKVVEDFIGRARKLESDLSRLEKRASILDIRVDCHDLERFSIINRFAKFHGRGQTTEGVENSSTSETAPRKIFPQRYVTALSMPGNLPEGVLCLSL